MVLWVDFHRGWEGTWKIQSNKQLVEFIVKQMSNTWLVEGGLGVKWLSKMLNNMDRSFDCRPPMCLGGWRNVDLLLGHIFPRRLLRFIGRDRDEYVSVTPNYHRKPLWSVGIWRLFYIILYIFNFLLFKAASCEYILCFFRARWRIRKLNVCNFVWLEQHWTLFFLIDLD